MNALADPHKEKPPSLLAELALAAFIALAPGFLLAAVVSPELRELFAINRSDSFLRTQIVCWLLIAGGLIGRGYVARLSKRGEAALVDALHELNRRWLGLLAGIPLAMLLSPNMETELPVVCCLLSLLAAALVGRTVFEIERGQAAAPSPAMLRHATVGLLALAAVAVCALVIDISFFHLHMLYIPSWDLAVYHNLVWHTEHGGFLDTSILKSGTHLSSHFDPILFFLAPFYALVPRAETLIVFQTLVVLSGVAPAYLLTKRVTGDSIAAAMIGAIYLISPGILGALTYEFHSLTLIAPLPLWLLYFVERRSLAGIAFSLALLLAVREDASFVAIGIGLAVGLSGAARTGAAIATIAAAYFAFVKGYVMTSSDIFMSGPNLSDFSGSFAALLPNPQEGVRGLLSSIVLNLPFTLRVMCTPGKLLFFLQLLVPVLFLPLLSGARLFAASYGFVLCFLASSEASSSLYTQYNIVLTPIVIALAPFGLARLAERRGIEQPLRPMFFRSLMSIAVVAAALVSAKFGPFVPNDAYRISTYKSLHFLSAERRERKVEDFPLLLALHAQVPPDASVASGHFTLPFFADRAKVEFFPGEERECDYTFVAMTMLYEDQKRHLERLVRDGVLELVTESGRYRLYRNAERFGRSKQ